MGEFVFKIEGTNTNNANLALVYSFTQGEKIIMKFELGVKGNWTPDNIDREDVLLQDVVHSGNASFQVLGIKAVGQVDATNLGKKIEEIDNKYNDIDSFEEDSLSMLEYMDAINQYAKLSLRFVSNNNIIAKMEAYPVFFEDTYNDWVYNENTGTYEMVEVTEKYIDLGLQFVFGDGSKIDAEVYFDNGFDDIINEMEDYFKELENRYEI